jgi:aspartate beta-hydroxylase
MAQIVVWGKNMESLIEDQLRKYWAQMIGMLLDCGRTGDARACADWAVKLGAWRDPLQRPVHYLPHLAARPVHDPRQFWFTGYLEQNFEPIRAEVSAYFRADGTDFRPYDARLIDRGKWEQIVLYDDGEMVGPACEIFPVTSSVVSTISETSPLGMISVSVVFPGTHIIPHCGPTNARLRVHLCICESPDASIVVGGQELRWKQGECIVFDDSFEHEVWHRGREPRIVLILDVWHPDLQPGEIQALSKVKSRDETIRSFMMEKGLRRIDCDATGTRAQFHPDDQTNRAVMRLVWQNGVRAVELRAGRLYYDASACTGRDSLRDEERCDVIAADSSVRHDLEIKEPS